MRAWRLARSLRQGIQADAVPAAEGAVDGWFAPGYGVREPSRVLRVRQPARAGATIATMITPPDIATGPA